MAGWEEGMHMAIATAMQTGVLLSLASTAADRGLTSAAMASQLGLDPRATALLLELLVEAGYAHRSSSSPPEYLPGPHLVALQQSPMTLQFTLQLWSHMAQFVRTGVPVAEMDGDVSAREHAYRDSTAGLVFYEKAAADFVDRLGVHPRRAGPSCSSAELRSFCGEDGHPGGPCEHHSRGPSCGGAA
eukprot:RCo045175